MPRSKSKSTSDPVALPDAPKSKTDNAKWTLADETTLIVFLHEHRSAAGDSASFKAVTFNEAATVVDAIRTEGGPKTGTACLNKWGHVRNFISPPFVTFSCFYLKLRRIFRAIQAIKNQSGWTWSDTRGADIAPDMEQEWAKFVKIYKEAKPFKNHGWVHLEKMTDIMPVTLRGTHVYRPSQGITGMDTAARLPCSPSPDWDDSAFDRPSVSPLHDEIADEINDESDVEVRLLSYFSLLFANTFYATLENSCTAKRGNKYRGTSLVLVFLLYK